MAAGWPGNPASTGTPRRLIAVAGGLSLTLAAACSASTGRPRPPAPTTHATARPATPPTSAPVAMALQITPAPYQLPSPVAREVVLARGSDLLIAGGLGLASASTDKTSLLNPVTGRVTMASRLAKPTHDAAGAILSGQAYVFGGGAAAPAWRACRRSTPAVRPRSPPGCPGRVRTCRRSPSVAPPTCSAGTTGSATTGGCWPPRTAAASGRWRPCGRPSAIRR